MYSILISIGSLRTNNGSASVYNVNKLATASSHLPNIVSVNDISHLFLHSQSSMPGIGNCVQIYKTCRHTGKKKKKTFIKTKIRMLESSMPKQCDRSYGPPANVHVRSEMYLLCAMWYENFQDFFLYFHICHVICKCKSYSKEKCSS